MLFTFKYAPKNRKQVFGQEQAVGQLSNFIQNYSKNSPKAALLYGPVGNGKTSSVYALANELGYDVLELNSSDLRNEANLSSMLGAALGQRSLLFRPKIVLIDEVDNLSGIYDRGGASAILKAMETSSFPLVLTANDIYDQKLKQLRKECLPIEFQKLQHKVVAHALEWVCQQESIPAEQKALATIARQADGDLRGALLDLHVAAASGKVTFTATLQLSDRKRKETIINALLIIFKASTAENALPALADVDLDFSQVIQWLDANVPKEYSSPSALAKAYEALSRADVFQGRIARWQHWRFLVYISDFLTAGISTAKEEKNRAVVQYKPTLRFLQQWQAKQKWGKKKGIALKLAKRTHTSQKTAFQQVDFLKPALASSPVAQELDLTEEEQAWLKGAPHSPHAFKLSAKSIK